MDRRRLIMGLAWDVGLPVVVYYGCRAFGVDALLALAAGGLAALTRVGCVAALRRRLDGLGVFVGVSFVLVLAVSLLAGDPRVLLARESILSGAAGLVLVGSGVIGRPVLYAMARRVNAGKDDLLAQWDQRWRTQPSFRRRFVVLSTVLGGVLLTESALRLLLIYLLPVDVVPGLSTALHVGTVALLVGWALWYRARRQRVGAASQLAGPARAERLGAR